LQYLDNKQNAAGHFNENYARELMELHTLGVDGGYTSTGRAAARHVLTGAGINVGNPPNSNPNGSSYTFTGWPSNSIRLDTISGPKVLLGPHHQGARASRSREAVH